MMGTALEGKRSRVYRKSALIIAVDRGGSGIACERRPFPAESACDFEKHE